MGCSYCQDCEACEIGGVLDCKSWPADRSQVDEQATVEGSLNNGTCSLCQKVIEPTWSFCPFCGAALEAGSAVGHPESKSVTLFFPKKPGTKDACLIGYREIVSRETGALNYVLEFDDNSEVVMPGTWSIRESEFPHGLYKGQRLAAYWEADESGVERFHLHEVK